MLCSSPGGPPAAAAVGGHPADFLLPPAVSVPQRKQVRIPPPPWCPSSSRLVSLLGSSGLLTAFRRGPAPVGAPRRPDPCPCPSACLRCLRRSPCVLHLRVWLCVWAGLLQPTGGTLVLGRGEGAPAPPAPRPICRRREWKWVMGRVGWAWRILKKHRSCWSGKKEKKHKYAFFPLKKK